MLCDSHHEAAYLEHKATLNAFTVYWYAERNERDPGLHQLAAVSCDTGCTVLVHS